ncbi:MAG: choice-of-anchor Q domain-containing protein [Pseudomonadota bacterium]|nr:choice-of-anchor Q domain-containing protein [Pseudomonadota bacterium]
MKLKIKFTSAPWAVAVFLIVSMFASSVNADIYYVPDDFTTIQGAIDASVSNSDTVMVRPGTYYENLDIREKVVSLISTDGPKDTVIDGGGVGSVVNLYRAGGGSLLEGFTITNGAASYGGGINIYWSSLIVRDCVITGNIATQRGGGVAVQQYAGFTAYDSVFENNHAESGGGFYVRTGGLFIHRTQILNNTATLYGGAFFSFGFVSNPNLHDSVVAGNLAKDGGGFYSWGRSADARATNSIITDNVAEYGGPFYTRGGGFFARNSTIVNNTATVEGGGGYADADTNYVRSVNSVIYHNSSPPVLLLDPANTVITYTDIEGGLLGEGNIDADPQFVDLADGDYHLRSGSPCIDSGTSAENGLPDHDIEGNPRPQGLNYDMGAYEMPPCREVPQFDITSFDPEIIWPPNKETVDITVTGSIILPDACNLISAGYTLIDEYGEHSSSDTLDVDEDGGFMLSLPVTAWRDGDDKIGRSYTLSLDAQDEAGAAGSDPLVATVPHDQSDE